MTTPKLTAEEKGLLSSLIGRPITDEDVIVLRLFAAVKRRVATATHQAFEEAAKIDATASVMTSKDYYRGFDDGIAYDRAAIRALAKEKAG